MVKRSVRGEMFHKEYSEVFQGDARWNSVKVPTGDLYEWNDKSTYIRKPPYFDDMVDPETLVQDLTGLRVLAMLGDSVTTDHISPAGNIAVDSPAGKYLISLGVKPGDFNSYGARRGNHEVMVRGTLANIRLRNQLAPGTEGGWTTHVPSGEKMFIYDASVQYQQEGTPLLIIAGKEYGSGSSRDWAAKGHAAAGRARGDRRELRAHSSLEPGRDGRAADAVFAGRESRIAGADRVRELRDRRHSERVRSGAHAKVRVVADKGVREKLRGDRADRYADGSRVLSQRRNSAVRGAAAGGADSRYSRTRTNSARMRYFSSSGSRSQDG